MFKRGSILSAVVALMLVTVGCQADPKSWQGELKFLNVEAVAFTPRGDGLVMVGPRRGGGDDPNRTAYYHLDLSTMAGRRLGYGRRSLGQMLICPFEDWGAVPIYLRGGDARSARTGYELYDLPSGELFRLVEIDDPALFVPHASAAGGPSAATQPDPERLVAAWRKISLVPLTAGQQQQLADFRPRWLARRTEKDPTIEAEVVDGQAFYVLDSPDRRHRLFIRFHPPSGKAVKAADPSGKGYAYGFVRDTRTRKRHMLYTTSGTDQFFDTVGSAVVKGPVWLVKQPIKLFRRQ